MWSTPPSISAPIRATQSTRRSRVFHTSPRRPPGRSTRATSGTARSTSTQCHACATSTASTDASPSGIASALPRSAGTPGSSSRELLSHALGGLHGDHLKSAGDELPGQLARARAEVEHSSRAGRQQPVERGLRITGPRPLVHVGSGTEGAGLPRAELGLRFGRGRQRREPNCRGISWRRGFASLTPKTCLSKQASGHQKIGRS